MSTELFKDELEFLETNKKKFLKEYPEKYLLIHGKELIGTFDNYENAGKEGVRRFGIEEPFLIHQIAETPPVNFVMSAAF